MNCAIVECEGDAQMVPAGPGLMILLCQQHTKWWAYHGPACQEASCDREYGHIGDHKSDPAQ